MFSNFLVFVWNDYVKDAETNLRIEFKVDPGLFKPRLLLLLETYVYNN